VGLGDAAAEEELEVAAEVLLPVVAVGLRPALVVGEDRLEVIYDFEAPPPVGRQVFKFLLAGQGGDDFITQLAPDPICVRAFTITSKTTSG